MNPWIALLRQEPSIPAGTQRGREEPRRFSKLPRDSLPPSGDAATVGW